MFFILNLDINITRFIKNEYQVVLKRTLILTLIMFYIQNYDIYFTLCKLFIILKYFINIKERYITSSHNSQNFCFLESIFKNLTTYSFLRIMIFILLCIISYTKLI